MTITKPFKTPASLKSTIMMLKRTRTEIRQYEERIAELEKKGFTHVKRFDISDCKSVSEVIAKASNLLTERGDVTMNKSYYGNNTYQYAATEEEVTRCIERKTVPLNKLKSREAFYEKLLTDKVFDIQRVVGKQLETA